MVHHNVCITVVHNAAQNSSDNLPWTIVTVQVLSIARKRTDNQKQRNMKTDSEKWMLCFKAHHKWDELVV